MYVCLEKDKKVLRNILDKVRIKFVGFEIKIEILCLFDIFYIVFLGKFDNNFLIDC